MQEAAVPSGGVGVLAPGGEPRDVDVQKCADVSSSAVPGLWQASPESGLHSAAPASATLEANGCALSLGEKDPPWAEEGGVAVNVLAA